MIKICSFGFLVELGTFLLLISENPGFSRIFEEFRKFSRVLVTRKRLQLLNVLVMSSFRWLIYILMNLKEKIKPMNLIFCIHRSEIQYSDTKYDIFSNDQN